MNQKTIKWFFTLCSIFGTFPCVMDGQSWKTIRFYTVWSLTLSTICVIGLCSCLIMSRNDNKKFTEKVYHVEQPILAYVQLAVMILNKKKLCKLMNLMSQQGHSTRELKNCYPFVTVAWLVFITAGIAGQIIVYTEFPGHYMFRGILSMYVLITLILPTHQFSLLVRLITEQFIKLNRNLAKQTKSSITPYTKLAVINYMHLVELAEATCQAYGPILLVIITVCLVNVSLSSTFILSKVPMESFIFNLYNVLWGLNFVCMMLDMISSCEKTLSQADKFNKLLMSCTIEFNPRQLLMNPYVIMHFISKKPLAFTACECVNITYRLGCSMIAVSVTYFIVLVQIDIFRNFGNNV